MPSDREQTTAEREGYVGVDMHGAEWRLARSEREQIVTAWHAYRRGERTDPIYSATGFRGSSVELDLSHIRGIVDTTPESIAREEEDDAIIRRRETLHGD